MSQQRMNGNEGDGRSSDGRKNQGEGDKDSARRYNEQQRAFVRSARGLEAIEEAGELSAEDAREGERAEAEGRARAQGEDPEILHRQGGDAQR